MRLRIEGSRHGVKKVNKKVLLCILGGIFSLVVAMGIGRFAYTPILPLMQEALRFSDAVAGYLASGNYAGYFVGAMLTGVLPLKRHRLACLRSSLAVSVMTTCMMGFSHSYALMLIVRFVSGVASAFIFVSTSSIVLDRLGAAGKTGWAGHLYSGVGLGILLSTLFIPSLNEWFMWEGAWIGLSVLSGVLAIFVWWWIDDSPDGHSNKDDHINIAQGPPLGWLPWLILAYGLEGLGYIVTGTFIVSMAERTPGFGNDPSLVWMVVGIAAMPSCIIWSALANRRGYVKALVLSMILQSVGIALPVVWMSPSGFVLSALLFGATFMGITTLATTLARQITPSNSSRIIGYMTAFYAAGQMAGPSIAGLLLSYTQSVQPALLGAAGVVFLGGAILASGIRYDRASGRAEGV
jgi:predicted MFS family arabinose efflux permease